MAPMILRSPPSISDYTTLPEHESRTPDSFFTGKPVLHYHATGAKAWLPASQRGTSGLPFFPADGAASTPSGDHAADINGEADELVEQTVDVFVTSE
jgi:chloride channel, nucleotide-sensitive, 1A